MSRTAKVTLAGTAAFAASAVLSGLLFDEHGGVLGALEAVLRTVVIVAAAVMVIGGFVLVLGIRRRPRSRLAGWLVTVPASAAFIWLVAVPVGYGVYLTHLPKTRPVVDADLGAPKENVTIEGAGGLRIRGWYVPSRNGAAVLALHGTGGSRSSMIAHARLLARHGYGVLALDLRGHGHSDGRSTSMPWLIDDDLDAAVRWLAARPDVDHSRIGAVGVSMGAEVALRAAVRVHDLRAIVSEGAMGGPGDFKASGADPATVAQLTVMSAVADVLTASRPGASDAELVARIAPRPILLISAGRSLEARSNRNFQRRGGKTTEHWNLPDAPHGSTLRVDPAGYERHVIPFLDRSLRG